MRSRTYHPRLHFASRTCTGICALVPREKDERADAVRLAVIVKVNFLLMESSHSFHVRIHSLLCFSETTLIETLPCRCAGADVLVSICKTIRLAIDKLNAGICDTRNQFGILRLNGFVFRSVSLYSTVVETLSCQQRIFYYDTSRSRLCKG